MGPTPTTAPTTSRKTTTTVLPTCSTPAWCTPSLGQRSSSHGPCLLWFSCKCALHTCTYVPQYRYYHACISCVYWCMYCLLLFHTCTACMHCMCDACTTTTTTTKLIVVRGHALRRACVYCLHVFHMRTAGLYFICVPHVCTSCVCTVRCQLLLSSNITSYVDLQVDHHRRQLPQRSGCHFLPAT